MVRYWRWLSLDEEQVGEKKADTPEQEKREDPLVRIDLEDIGQRIVALPIPARNYVGMRTRTFTPQQQRR